MRVIRHDVDEHSLPKSVIHNTEIDNHGLPTKPEYNMSIIGRLVPHDIRGSIVLDCELASWVQL